MANKYWVGNLLSGTGTDYEAAANWNPSGVPADGDNIFFDSTANTTCKISDARQVDNITIENNFDQLLEFDNIKSRSKYTILSADKDKLEKKKLNKKKIIKNFFILTLKSCS